MKEAIDFANTRRNEQLQELCSLVAIPSISTEPDHKSDVGDAAGWLRDWIVAEGGRSELIGTDGHPLVWGEFAPDTMSGSTVGGGPTILLYGHYDVQPVDPIDLWDTDPFAPTVKGDRLYGRGASDMKAQVLAALFAIQAIRHENSLPVTVRVLLEGEEEIGSPSLAGALREHGDRFAADVCLNPDVGMLGPEAPSIRYGLRGLAYYELTLTGPVRDLHSGAFGGVVHNPAQAMAEVVAGMHDSDGRVLLEGFYDRVREIDAKEAERLDSVPFDEDEVRHLTGVPEVWGDPEFSPTARVGARPTLEINGIVSGYTGPGAKTVIPSHAMAKISMRLVPDQRSEDVTAQFTDYLRKAVPTSVNWDLREIAAGSAFICDPTSVAHMLMSRALEDVWGVTPILSRSGGSVPVAAYLKDLLGIESVLTGFALPDDQVHSPNESQHLPTWYRGIEALIRFFGSLGQS